jgi:HAD superfamily hydrolase (TIGR01509 family)
VEAVNDHEAHHPIHAVIFDLDATLVDSEGNYYLADVELLRRRGVAFSQEEKRKYIGGGNLDMMVDLVRRFGLSDAPLALAEEKNAIYFGLALRDTPLYPQMKRFWDLVRARGLPVAVASGSSPSVLRAVLDKVGLAAEADAIVSAEDVARGKPAPDIFLEAARRLGVPPQHCAVVEDSRHGVEAASRASMPCIAVPYLTEKPLDDAFTLAELLFEDGMATFDPERALAWVLAKRG